ncbi:TlpA family protein disulfide reductase [Roseateles sp. BYS180W]|uniref:TlpA family protein disulfide reductase n=1 Tax=Roseateles rivi TaxID=3299028 RepID=A0ABW7FWS9_9BURK
MPASSSASERVRAPQRSLARLLLCAALAAAPAAVRAHPDEPQVWRATLAAVDGSRFLHSWQQSGPLLVNFWSQDCPPCVRELPLLQAFARANPHWTVWLVSLDAPAQAHTAAQALGLQLPLLRAGQNPAGLLRAAGNRQGALPYTLVLCTDASGATQRICQRQLGELSAGVLAGWGGM